MAKLKPRQRQILAALQGLGGRATTRAIAKRLGWSVNGVAQSLGAASMSDHVVTSGGSGGDVEWALEPGVNVDPRSPR